jgi:hypothetical protein
MSERWDSLRSKFQGKNIDLDAEFEKFLNEVRLSLSLMILIGFMNELMKN